MLDNGQQRGLAFGGQGKLWVEKGGSSYPCIGLCRLMGGFCVEKI